MFLNFFNKNFPIPAIFIKEIYTAYATPTSNYMFSDNSITAKSFQWLIQKAAQVISLNKTSLELENILMSDTVIVNRLGDGVIYVSSSDQNVVSVSNVDSEVKVSAVATGSATITINVAESKNYLSASVFVPVECFVIKPLAECSVEEIVTAIKSSKAANAWDVGDYTAPITKKILLLLTQIIILRHRAASNIFSTI